MALAELTTEPQRIIFARLDEQILWYERHSVYHKRSYKLLKGLVIAGYPPCQVNMATAEMMKSSTITTNDEETTALVVAQPTPSEPPLVRNPQYPETIGMAAP